MTSFEAPFKDVILPTLPPPTEAGCSRFELPLVGREQFFAVSWLCSIILFN